MAWKKTSWEPATHQCFVKSPKTEFGSQQIYHCIIQVSPSKGQAEMQRVASPKSTCTASAEAHRCNHVKGRAESGPAGANWIRPQASQTWTDQETFQKCLRSLFCGCLWLHNSLLFPQWIPCSIRAAQPCISLSPLLVHWEVTGP